MPVRKHRAILKNLIAKYENPRVAEIGVSDGPTSEFLLKNCPTIHLVMVDIWSAPDRLVERSKKMKQMMEDADKRTIFAKTRRKMVKASSLIAAKRQKNGSLNLVFLDACHRTPYVLADCAAWWPKLKSGGILCGHDRKREGVMDALSHFTNLIGEPFTTEDTVWMIKKP